MATFFARCQFREGGDGRGVVWAMPVDADFPEPCDCKKDRKRALQPPRPPAALDNEMEAIDGDGSPWSYLCDSLLGRELWSFGAIRRQRGWPIHTILGKNPWKGRRRAGDMPSADPAKWIWHQPQPPDWKPQVTVNGSKVTVTFFS